MHVLHIHLPLLFLTRHALYIPHCCHLKVFVFLFVAVSPRTYRNSLEEMLPYVIRPSAPRTKSSPAALAAITCCSRGNHLLLSRQSPAALAAITCRGAEVVCARSEDQNSLKEMLHRGQHGATSPGPSAHPLLLNARKITWGSLPCQTGCSRRPKISEAHLPYQTVCSRRQK